MRFYPSKATPQCLDTHIVLTAKPRMHVYAERFSAHNTALVNDALREEPPVLKGRDE